ncbi:MAG: RNA methyltransferase [Promethearchaeota archaeon]
MKLDKKKTKKEIFSFQETHKAQEYENLSFFVVLIQPEHSGNIGAIARVMKNFNFENLIIFNPKESLENIKGYQTQGFAMHGRDVLLNAEIIEVNNPEDHIFDFQNLLKRFDYVIGTTSRGKRHSNIRRLAIFPEDFNLPISVEPLKIAILFGKESHGLTNEEISLADVLLRIPTNKSYSALNLSHACGILLYEIFKKINILSIGRGSHPVLIADKEDRLMLFSIIKEMIEKLKIRSFKKDNVYFAFRNIFGRNVMSKRELSLILGFFSKINSIIKDRKLYQKQ